MAGRLTNRIAGAELRLARELAEIDISRRERAEIRDHARDFGESLGSREARADYLAFVEALTAVASKGGPAVEVNGENIIYNHLHFTFRKPAGTDTTFYRVIDRGDPIVAENEAAGVVVTRDDARALAAMFGARKGQREFDPDDVRRRDLRLVEDALADHFRFFNAPGASLVSLADAYAAGLEANWHDMTQWQRKIALEAFTDDGPLPARVARTFLEEDSLLDVALTAIGHGGDGLNTYGGSGRSGGYFDHILDATSDYLGVMGDYSLVWY